MEFWKDTNEVVTAMLKVFEVMQKDPEMGPALRGLNALILWDYSESGPGCSAWLDTRGGKYEFGGGAPTDAPTLTLLVGADDAHKNWSNRLNPIIAIARKKIRVKGSAAPVLKLAPKVKRVAECYNQALKELGWEDKILK